MALAIMAMGTDEKVGVTSEQAMKMLMDGNARFVSGNLTHPDQSPERRAEVLAGQHPFAVIVGCSDSRVPPEVIFDQGIGDLFVIRTAGEVMDNATLGSIEYAVEHLNVPLVVVLGHDSCGAVTAAISGGEAPGHLISLVEAITPAVEEARGMKGDLLNNSIDMNTKNIVEELKTTGPILSEAVKEGKLQIAPARYHLASGAVEFQ
jgi:carbonic anhydrase